VKPLEEAKRRWEQITSGKAGEYARGIETTTKNWQANTLAAVGAYEQGVQQAVANKSFEKGVKRITNEDWKAKAMDLGQRRFADGIRANVDKWAKKWAPYRETLAAITLPPRRAAGDVANYERVKIIGMKLHEKKVKG